MAVVLILFEKAYSVIFLSGIHLVNLHYMMPGIQESIVLMKGGNKFSLHTRVNIHTTRVNVQQVGGFTQVPESSHILHITFMLLTL